MKSRSSVRKCTKRKAVTTDDGVPLKRQREVDQEGSVQYVHRLLRDVQNDAGHPISSAMSTYGHSSILQLPFQPGILTQDTIHRHYESLPWNTTYPVPVVVHCSTTGNSDRKKAVEPMLSLVKAKKKHLTTLAYMKLLYARKKTIYRKACKAFEGRLYPNMVYKVAEEMERDPDRWFRETYGYDYYFTGGSLAVVDREQARCIINLVGQEMNVIEVVRFELDGNCAKIDSSNLKRIELDEEDGPVFEICCLDVDNESCDTAFNGLRIALRRKRKIELLCGDGEIDCSNMETLSSDIPFISCCFLRGSSSNSLICTSDLGKCLKIWDYDKREIVHELQLNKRGETDDCWTCVRSFGKNHIICLDRSSVKLFKTKANLTLVHGTTLSTWLWACEKASCLEIDAENKLLFVGTTHKLLVLKQVEQEAKPPEFQQIMTFTHNLKYFPTMIRFASNSNQNFFVWISSHLPGDTTICNFSKVPPKRFATVNLPRKPWTIQEAFHLARRKGKCIFPAANLKQRVQLFHSGLAILVDRERFHLFLQNSCGDVFYQQVIPASDSTNSEEIPAIYHSLMLKLNHKSSFVPKATDFKNLRGFKKILTCTKLNPPIGPEPLDTPFHRRPRWKQTVEELHQYKDILAQDMLQIWGFRPDVTREAERRRLSTEEPMDVTDRISHWLDTTAADEVTFVRNQNLTALPVESEVIPIESDNEEVLHSVVEVGEDIKPLPDEEAPELDVVFVRTAIMSEALASSVRKSAVKPARKKYVKGF